MGAGPWEHPFVFVIREEFLTTSGCFLWGWGRTGGGRKHRGPLLPQTGDAACLSPLFDHTGEETIFLKKNLPKMAEQDDEF